MSGYIAWCFPLVREALGRIPLAFWLVAGVGEGTVYYRIGRRAWRHHKSKHERAATGIGTEGW